MQFILACQQSWLTLPSNRVPILLPSLMEFALTHMFNRLKAFLDFEIVIETVAM
jgi:hypothetical protein